MKKFFALMAVAFMAIVLTGCENLKIGDEEMESGKMYFTQKSTGNVTSVIEDNIWKYKDNDNNIEFQVRLESGVEGYANDTTFTKEVSLSTVSFEKDGEEVILGWEKGELVYFNGDDEISSVKVRKHLQDYLHTLDKVSGKTLEFHYEAEVKTKSGKTIKSPARNPKMEVVGTPKVVETTSDEIANYFKFAMTYSFVIDSDENKPNLVCHKTLAVEGDTVVAKTDEGFQWLTFFDNGNPKTGKSWIEVTTTKNGHSTSDRKEVTLNFWQKGENYQTLVGASFAGIAEIGTGLGNEVPGQSYNAKAEIKVTPMTRQYNGGVKFDGKDNVKVLEIGREVAVWSDGVNTFNMPSPAYDNVSTSFGTPVDLPSSEGYERKLNTITLNASIYGIDIKNVKAETELRVKEETFTLTVVDSAFVYINPTTSDTKIKIRETGSNGSVREYERDVHVYNGIDDLASVTIDVNEFDSKASEAKLDENDVYVGKRESGEFTIYKYMQGYTTGSESVDEYFRPFYERAYHNPTGTWMMWRKYANFVDNGFTTTDLSDETVGGVTYLRKKYVYAMSAVYNGHNDSATGEAILRVVSDDDPQPVNPRVTPSWLGDPQWAEYTRVQKSEGAYFEDMIVFGYANGVVLAPKGVADLTNGVFAYDQNVASAHGVEKCANGSAYTAVWKASANKWIPAKCEFRDKGKSNETWIYTGRGVSHSVMANNAITLHIGTNVTWNPGEEVTISDGTITIKYSKNNSAVNGNDVISLK